MYNVAHQNQAVVHSCIDVVVLLCYIHDQQPHLLLQKQPNHHQCVADQRKRVPDAVGKARRVLLVIGRVELCLQNEDRQCRYVIRCDAVHCIDQY
jgi:hypothetical protein